MSEITENYLRKECMDAIETASIAINRLAQSELQLATVTAERDAARAEGRAEGLRQAAEKFRDLALMVGKPDREILADCADELDRMAESTKGVK